MFIVTAVELTDYDLTTTAVAKRLGVDGKTIARWADNGRLACIVTPGGWRKFRADDIDTFAATLARPVQP